MSATPADVDLRIITAGDLHNTDYGAGGAGSEIAARIRTMALEHEALRRRRVEDDRRYQELAGQIEEAARRTKEVLDIVRAKIAAIAPPSAVAR